MKLVRLIFTLLLIGVAATGYIVYQKLNMPIYLPKSDQKYTVPTGLKQDSKITNILLIGLDDDDNGSPRADTILLLSIDTKHEKLKLTSFLRDCYLKFPNGKEAKLNAAYSSGGAELLKATLENNFGVKIDNYMQFDFLAFQKIVDAFNGVSVTVTRDESKHLLKSYDVEIAEGTSSLTGYQALMYCRIRYLDSDFSRTARQRKVFRALITQAKDIGILELNPILDESLPSIATDMNKSSFASFCLNAFIEYKNYETEEFSIPAEKTFRYDKVNQSSVLKIDVKTNANKLKKFLYE